MDQPTQLTDVLCTCLSHPVQAVRLAAASCLRQLVIVVPSQRIPLLNKCLHCLQQSHRYSAETLLGVTFGITGLLAGVNYSILGLPNNVPDQVSLSSFYICGFCFVYSIGLLMNSKLAVFK